MKFKDYLQNEDITKSINTISRECSEIIEIYNQTGNFLFRGERNNFIIKLKSHLKDRIPMHTPKEIHELVNDYFMKNFGWKGRNGVFASNKIIQTVYYGSQNIFLPINEFKYIYSPIVYDLSDQLGVITDYNFDKWSQNDKNETYIKLSKLIETYTDKNIKSMICSTKNIEISFNCKYYYLIHYKTLKYYKEEFKSIFTRKSYANL